MAAQLGRGLRPGFQVGVPSQRRLSRQEAAVRGSCSSTPRFHLPEDAARPPRSFLCSPTARDSQSAPVSWQCSRGGSLLPGQRGCVWGVPGMVAMAVARPRGRSAVCCGGLPLSPCCHSSGQVGLAALCSETATRQVGWSWPDRIGIPSRAWDGGAVPAPPSDPGGSSRGAAVRPHTGY